MFSYYYFDVYYCKIYARAELTLHDDAPKDLGGESGFDIWLKVQQRCLLFMKEMAVL